MSLTNSVKSTPPQPNHSRPSPHHPNPSPKNPTRSVQIHQTQFFSPSQALLHYLIYGIELNTDSEEVFEEFPIEEEFPWQMKEVRFWGLFPNFFPSLT